MADRETARRQDASVRDHFALDDAPLQDEERERRQVMHGQTFVVTRLNPGGVCHVGYVDGAQSGRQ